MKLRNYQLDAVSQVYFEWRNHRKVLLWMNTGGGKTEVATYIVNDAIRDDVPVVMIVRGRELVKNLSQRLDRYKIDHSVYMAGHYRYNPKKLVQVCSIDTIKSRSTFPHIDKRCIVILDEAHKKYDVVFDNYKSQWILGLTATPFENCHNFESIVKPIDAYELRDEGHLVPEKIFCPHIVDTSNIKIIAGDFKRDQIEDLMTQSQIVGDVVRDWLLYGDNRPTVCFAVSVNHSIQLTQAFNESNIKAFHCDANSSEEERNKATKGLLDGSIKVLCNVDIFSVGWDCPPVSCVILARPTWSLIWYLQAVGRGLRSFDGKADCVVLDNAGNVFRHGTPYRIREASLEKKVKTDRSGDESISTCSHCYFVYSSKETECPSCGGQRPPRTIKETDGNLVEYQDDEEKTKRMFLKSVQTAYYKVKFIEQKRGLYSNFALVSIKNRFGKKGLDILRDYLKIEIPNALL